MLCFQGHAVCDCTHSSGCVFMAGLISLKKEINTRADMLDEELWFHSDSVLNQDRSHRKDVKPGLSQTLVWKDVDRKVFWRLANHLKLLFILYNSKMTMYHMVKAYAVDDWKSYIISTMNAWRDISQLMKLIINRLVSKWKRDSRGAESLRKNNGKKSNTLWETAWAPTVNWA